MNAVVAFALKQRIVMVVLLAFVLVVGVGSFMKLDSQAHPGPVPPLVEIVTQSTGQSAEAIEREITIPIEIQMAGIPHLTAIRTMSLFGLSDIKIQFGYDFTYQQADQWVIDRLSQLPPLPNGAQPGISQESPIGEIYHYQVIGSPGYSISDLRTVEDWILERRFKALPGVIDVAGWSGKTRAYDVAIDQNKLVDSGLTLPQVLQALGNSNINLSGQTVEFGPQRAVVHGIGLVHSMDEMRKTTLTSNNGAPVLLSDVATISLGRNQPFDIGNDDDQSDIVQGIVLMRRGLESMPAIESVQREVEYVNSSGILPPGVQVEKFHNGAELAGVITHTALYKMVFGIVLIVLIRWFFPGNLRGTVTNIFQNVVDTLRAAVAVEPRGEREPRRHVPAVGTGQH